MATRSSARCTRSRHGPWTSWLRRLLGCSTIDPAAFRPSGERRSGCVVTTIADLVIARRDDDRAGLITGDQQWSWQEVVQAAADRASLCQHLVDPARPPHIGVLLENVPEYVWWLGAAALTGAVIVGINPTRRG